MHFWMMAGAAHLVPNVELAGRLLSLICGIAALWPLFWLAKTLFDRTAAQFALLVFAFYSLHIAYGNTSSSESAYIFLLLLGLAGCFAWLRSRHLGLMLIGAAALTLASAIRWEAWVVLFAVGILLLLRPSPIWSRRFRRRRELAGRALFLAVGASWPVAWILYSIHAYGHPFYYVRYNHVWVSAEQSLTPASRFYHLLLPPGTLLLSLCCIGVAAALYGLWLSLRTGKARGYSLLVLFLAAAQTYQMATGNVEIFARYAIGVGTLLTVLAGYGLSSLQQHSRLPVWKAATALLALNLAAITALSIVHWKYSDKFRSISPLIQEDVDMADMGKFLKAQKQPGNFMLFDDYNEDGSAWPRLAGYSLLSDYDGEVFVASHRVQRTQEYFLTHHPRFVLYSPHGSLRSYLPLPSGCRANATILGRTYNCVRQEGRFMVYEAVPDLASN